MADPPKPHKYIGSSVIFENARGIVCSVAVDGEDDPYPVLVVELTHGCGAGKFTTVNTADPSIEIRPRGNRSLH